MIPRLTDDSYLMTHFGRHLRESQKDNLTIPELFSLKINLLFPNIDIDSRSELIWTGLVCFRSVSGPFPVNFRLILPISGQNFNII